MREIKFRGKTKEGEWVYGDLETRRLDGRCFIHTYTEDRLYYTQFEILPDTIGQYTGLMDANGKEIYEGDIVRYRLTDERYKKNPRYSNLPIHYDESQAKFEAGNIYWDTLRSNKVEVIGNVHDDPELIEK